MSNRSKPDPVDDSGSPSSFSPQSYFRRYLSLNQNQNPLNDHIRMLSQIQNPSNMNQTLEHAFSRLSVSNNNNSGFTNNPSYGYDYSNLYNYGFQNSNFGQMQETAIGNNRHVRSNSIAHNAEIQNLLMRYDRENVRFNDYEFMARQNGFFNTLSNGGVGDELRRTGHSGSMNESLGNNVSWVNNNVNVNGNGNGNGRRSPHWFDDFRGRVYSLAKDQHGSRILQEVIKKFGSEGVSYIFSELVNHVTELMIDPFGNYVVQKMVEICNEDQQTRIVLMVTYHSFQLIRICLSPHGSRAVEKLLENVTTREQRTLIMAALSPGAIALSKDINGHRVVLHCLKNFTHEDTKQFLNVVASNSLAIARDKTGCCVLQHCVNHAQGETRNQLIDDIVLNSSLLAEDCYGNYVVQHLLSLKMPRITDNLVRELERQFVYLACNKYGSNVVEKFIQDSGELQSARVILELLADPNVARLLVDPYGNYVIQSALTASKGPIRNAILDLIQRNSQMMRNNVYGKKLLDRFDKGKVRHNI